KAAQKAEEEAAAEEAAAEEANLTCIKNALVVKNFKASANGKTFDTNPSWTMTWINVEKEPNKGINKKSKITISINSNTCNLTNWKIESGDQEKGLNILSSETLEVVADSGGGKILTIALKKAGICQSQSSFKTE